MFDISDFFFSNRILNYLLDKNTARLQNNSGLLMKTFFFLFKIYFRYKIFVFSVRMVRHSIKRRKHVLIGVMWIVNRQHYIMAVTILIFIALVPGWKVNGHHLPKKKRPHFICNELKPVSICSLFRFPLHFSHALSHAAIVTSASNIYVGIRLEH